MLTKKKTYNVACDSSEAISAHRSLFSNLVLTPYTSIQIATSYHPLTPTLNVYICVLNSMMFYLMSRISMGFLDPLWTEMKYLPYSGLMLSLTALPAGETTAPRHTNFYLGIRTAGMCSKHANNC